MARGRILCITGVSGAGKGTVIAALRERHPELWFSVSATTRAKRPAEIEGVDYHFVSDAEFDAMIETGELVEWVDIYGHRSGTPKAPIDTALAAGREVLLEVEVRGASFVKNAYPDATVVFLKVRDADVQRERLRRRGTTGADLDRRLRETEEELSRVGEFDAVVVNDELATTIREVETILFPSV